MGDDFPDLHHKLCKKLAHLTTSFYFLNMKNDENELIVQNIMDSYEKEMDSMVKTTNEMLESYTKDNPQYKETHEILMAYKKFKQKFEEERSLSIEEFKNYQLRVEEKEQALREEMKIKLASYQKEVDSMTEKINYMKDLVDKTIKGDVEVTYRQKKASEFEEKRLRAELEGRYAEINDLKARYFELERMYRELEEAHLVSRKGTSEGWSRELGENDKESLNNILRSEVWAPEALRKKVIEQEKLIVVLRNALGQESGMVLDHENIGSIELGGNSVDEASGMSLPLRIPEVKSNPERMREKNEDVLRLRGHRKESLSDDRMHNTIEEYENRLNEVIREHNQVIEQLHIKYNENIAEMETEFEKEKKSWQTMFQSLHETLDRKNETIAELEEKMKALEALEKKMSEEAQTKKESKELETTLNMEIQRLSMLLQDSKKQFDEKWDAEKKKSEEIKSHLIEELRLEKKKSLERVKGEKEKQIEDLQAEVKAFREAPIPTEFVEEYQNKLRDLSQRHNTYVRELIEKHDEKVESIEKQYEKELNELRRELEREKENVMKMKEDDKNSEISNVKKEYEAKLHKISKNFDHKLEEKVNEYEGKINAKEIELMKQRKELDYVREQLKGALKKVEEREMNFVDLERIILEQKNSILLLQESESIGRASPMESGLFTKDETFKTNDEGPENDNEKDKLIREHINYVQETKKQFAVLKKHHEEKVQLLFEKYNELYKAYESRPSRPEDIALINQLQDDYLEKGDSGVRKLSNNSKIFPESTKKESFNKVFSSQVISNGSLVNGSALMEKGKKSQKQLAAGSGSILPPIAISQFTIQFRSPTTTHGHNIVSNKKFFKRE